MSSCARTSEEAMEQDESRRRWPAAPSGAPSSPSCCCSRCCSTTSRRSSAAAPAAGLAAAAAAAVAVIVPGAGGVAGDEVAPVSAFAGFWPALRVGRFPILLALPACVGAAGVWLIESIDRGGWWARAVSSSPTSSYHGPTTHVCRVLCGVFRLKWTSNMHAHSSTVGPARGPLEAPGRGQVDRPTSCPAPQSRTALAC